MGNEGVGRSGGGGSGGGGGGGRKKGGEGDEIRKFANDATYSVNHFPNRNFLSSSFSFSEPPPGFKKKEKTESGKKMSAILFFFLFS